MRLVSAVYADYHPFYKFDMFNDYVTTNDPTDLEYGDVLVIWGGGDISPSLYGKLPSKRTYASAKLSQRDQIEWILLQAAREKKIPIVGVCRGGQMLTAAAGGYLIQHVNNHGRSHEVETIDGENFLVNSIHHQMMVPPKNGEYEMVAWCPTARSDVYVTTNDKGQDEEVEVKLEPEFIYYPNMKGFAVQWHPEGMDAESQANQYLKNYMEKHL